MRGSAGGRQLAARGVGGTRGASGRKTSKQSEGLRWSDGHLQKGLQAGKNVKDSLKKQETSGSPSSKTGGKHFQALPLS